MRKPFRLIGITTAILVLITSGSLFGFNWIVVFWLVLLGHIMLIVTVISVLKAPVQSKKTFETDFYEDLDYKRNTPAER